MKTETLRKWLDKEEALQRNQASIFNDGQKHQDDLMQNFYSGYLAALQNVKQALNKWERS